MIIFPLKCERRPATPHHAALACSLLAPDPPRLLSGRIDAGGLERKSCYDGKGPCAFYWNCQKMEASKDKESTMWDIDYPYFEEVRSQYYPQSRSGKQCADLCDRKFRPSAGGHQTANQDSHHDGH